MISPGELYDVTSAASVQFAGNRGLRFRVIRVWVLGSTPTGWVWLDGYVVDDITGLATERREIFVQVDGLIPVETRSTSESTARRPRNTGPARLSQQRTRTSTTHRSTR